jgi:hypothetical protein
MPRSDVRLPTARAPELQGKTSADGDLIDGHVRFVVLTERRYRSA